MTQTITLFWTDDNDFEASGIVGLFGAFRDDMDQEAFDAAETEVLSAAIEALAEVRKDGLEVSGFFETEVLATVSTHDVRDLTRSFFGVDVAPMPAIGVKS